MGSFVIITLLLALVASTHAQTCRALVFQDGNDYVYFQAGAASSLASQNDYDVIVGSGFAALTALQVAQEKSAQEIRDYWHDFKQELVLESWPYGFAQAFVNKPSFYNTTVLIDTVRRLVQSAPLKKRLVVLATDINKGLPYYVTESNDTESLVRGLVGTASQPYFFEPIVHGDKKLVTLHRFIIQLAGSMITYVDFQSAIAACREMVGSEQNIIIDAIFAQTKTVKQVETSGYRGYQMARRYFELNSYVKSMNSLFHAKTDHPAVTFDRLVSPQADLKYARAPFGNTQQVNEAMFEQGINDASHHQDLLGEAALLYTNLYTPHQLNGQ